MIAPLMVLALLSIIGGWVGVPASMGGHNEIGNFLAPVMHCFASSRTQVRQLSPAEKAQEEAEQRR